MLNPDISSQAEQNCERPKAAYFDAFLRTPIEGTRIKTAPMVSRARIDTLAVKTDTNSRVTEFSVGCLLIIADARKQSSTH
jgi:hypothetical protein